MLFDGILHFAEKEQEPKLTCEYCGWVDFAYTFKGSKRFCSVVCAKRQEHVLRVVYFKVSSGLKSMEKLQRSVFPTKQVQRWLH